MGGDDVSGRAMGRPEYVNAYLNGMQFVLLALQGRLKDLDGDDRRVIEEFVEEYNELAMEMRERSRLGVRP